MVVSLNFVEGVIEIIDSATRCDTETVQATLDLVVPFIPCVTSLLGYTY